MAIAAEGMTDDDGDDAHGSAEVWRCCCGDMTMESASDCRGDGGIMTAGPASV